MRSSSCYGARVRQIPKPPVPRLDPATLDHVLRLLTERLDAVVTYGAGGCPTCHDAELRAAIGLVRGLASPAPATWREPD